jgi:hypothetical protein
MGDTGGSDLRHENEETTPDACHEHDYPR